MERRNYVPQAAALTSLCLLFVVRYMDSIWSQSVDLAHHYALTARLAEFWSLPLRDDPTLGEMSIYPRLSHVLAAIAGSFFNSPLIGMQLVTLISLFVLWASLVFIVLSLPRRYALVSSALLVVCLLVNKSLFRVELYGHEVIGSYFFAQLVAQAFAVLAVVLFLYAEKSRASPLTRYLPMMVVIPLVMRIHLLPAMELLGWFAAVIMVDLLLADSSITSSRIANIVVGALLILATAAMVILHRSFAAMRLIAAHNGGLDLRHISGMGELVLLCLAVGIVSGVLVVRWAVLDTDENRRNLAALKHVGLFGLSAAGLCFLQILGLKLGHGSEYAAKKYAFGLYTILLLEIALLPLLFVSREKFKMNLENKGSLLYSSLLPCLLIAASLFSLVPTEKAADTSDIVSLERQVRLLRDTALPVIAGGHGYAVGLPGMSPTISYMLSIGVLKAPRSANAYDILSDRPLSDLATVSAIVTSENQRYDIEACRRTASASGVILLDGECVRETLTHTDRCRGVADFTSRGWLADNSVQGFSGAEGHGRWTDGKNASFVCTVSDVQEEKPKRVRISTAGFVYGGHSQRAIVSISGSKPTEYRYEPGKEHRIIELPLRHVPAGKLQIDFVLPDAASPQELGLNCDPRKLGISVRSIDFR